MEGKFSPEQGYRDIVVELQFLCRIDTLGNNFTRCGEILTVLFDKALTDQVGTCAAIQYGFCRLPTNFHFNSNVAIFH